MYAPSNPDKRKKTKERKQAPKQVESRKHMSKKAN